MKRPRQIFSTIVLLAGSYGFAQHTGNEPNAPEPFVVANAHFEQNATDEDVEVVFEAKGHHEGLTKLTVVSPDGRTVVDFTAPGAATMGMRQFRFESPEPRDVASIKRAFPEGKYTFTGTTSTGAKLYSESMLAHSLPATASFLQPGVKSQGVSASLPKITWTPVKNLTAVIVNIEQEETNVNLTVRLPGSATSFAVPNGFLHPDTQYTLSIGTVTEDGNVSFVETWFETAGK